MDDDLAKWFQIIVIGSVVLFVLVKVVGCL